MSFFFFFQAEDGIRDWSVTGVQTCALPIYPTATDLIRLLPDWAIALGLAWSVLHFKVGLALLRSEERRVGKECRSRWSTDHQKKRCNKRQEKTTTVRNSECR